MNLFQLLYLEHPELLVDILDAAKKCIAEGANKDEATLQDLQVKSSIIGWGGNAYFSEPTKLCKTFTWYR